MLRYNEIQEKLLHLIGWKQNYDTSELKINEDLTESESGLFFQQAHPLLTLENLASIAPDFKNADFPEFDSRKFYKKGDIVKYNGRLYKAKEDLEPYFYEGEVPYPAKQNLYKNGEFWLIDSPYASSDDIIDSSNIPVGMSEMPYGQNTIVLKPEGHGIPIRCTSKGKRLIGPPVNPWEDPKINNAYTEGSFTMEITTKGLPNKDGQLADTVEVRVGYVFTNKGGNPLGDPNDNDFLVGRAFNYVYEGGSYHGEESVTHRFVLHTEDLRPSASLDLEGMEHPYVAPVLKIANGQGGGIVVENIGIYAGNWEATSYTHPEFWQEVDLFQECFSEWLKDKTKASIQKAMSAFCNKKLSMGTQKALLENRTLFDGTGRLSDIVENRGRIVGFEIVPVRSRGVSIKINRVGLQSILFELGEKEFTLFLSHSSSKEVIGHITVTLNSAKGAMVWSSSKGILLTARGGNGVDVLLDDGETANLDSGGSYYLWYRQPSTASYVGDIYGANIGRSIDTKRWQAVNKSKDWSKEPCAACSRNEAVAYAAWSKYIEIHPFYVPDTDTPYIYAEGADLISGMMDFIPDYADAYISNPRRETDFFKDIPSPEAVAEFVERLKAKYRIPEGFTYSTKIMSAEELYDFYRPYLNPAREKDFVIDSAVINEMTNYAGSGAIAAMSLKYDTSLWDISKNVYTYDNNYGLNLDITVECDLTDFIIEQKNLFIDILMKQVAVDMLREFAYNANVRTNRHSLNASRSDILYEIDGDSSSMKQSGLAYQLEQAIAAADMSLRGIDRVCLPCKNNGVKYRSV